MFRITTPNQMRYSIPCLLKGFRKGVRYKGYQRFTNVIEVMLCLAGTSNLELPYQVLHLLDHLSTELHVGHVHEISWKYLECEVL